MLAPSSAARHGIREGGSPGSLLELLARQAASRPASAAVAAPGRPPLSYARLWEQVTAGGGSAAEFGVGPGDRVVTVLPDGPETAVAFLTFACVASVAPLNPVSTEAEIERSLARLRPKIVVVPEQGTAVRAAASRLQIPIVTLRSDADAEAGVFTLASDRQRDAVEAAPSSPDDAALVLSTSGTTADPKLVPLSHRNVIAAAAATCTAHGLGDADHRLNVMPLSHVQGLVGAVAASLVAGAAVVCTPGFDAERTIDWLEEFEVTWFSASPTMHREILRVLRRRSPTATALRFVRAGSAALPPQLRAEMEDVYGVPVVESYGMTEAHQIASTPLPPGHHKPGTVGPPTGSAVAIVDERGEPVPPETTGEILIQGPNVTAGYLDDPPANASAFVDGWLRTGDLGWIDRDGYLTLTGRLKEIINRGGEKISPREIEEALLENRAVDEAVAFGIPHPVLQEDVAAVAVLAADRPATESDLRTFLARRLAPFKVPRRILLVDSIPKGPGGKVQRIKLPELLGLDSADVEEPAESQLEARSAVETALTALWCEVLQAPAIGPDEDFFFLGGDSLLGTRLLARVRNVFGVDLPPLAMYDEASTVATMATVIERMRAA
jgi:oxalate---CoA ligase